MRLAHPHPNPLPSQGEESQVYFFSNRWKRTTRERVSSRSFTTLILSVLFAFLSACNPNRFPASTFAPRSDMALWVQEVYFEVIGWDTLILILICVLIYLVLTRYSTRASEDQPKPPPPHPESLGLEVAWTVGPALILLFIAVPSLRIVFRSQEKAPPPDALIIKVTAHQWWWQFDYPSMGIHTANEAHLPVGRPVRFLLYSDDVIHSFWIPAEGGKRDVVPGHVNELTFTPQATGSYIGECAEFCGLSHANMRFEIVVQNHVAFDDWRANQAGGPHIPKTESARQGESIYTTSACTTCHTISGYSAGYIGPNLTHFGSRATFAGNTLPNTPENVAAWITNPEALKPGAQMPPLGLRGEELNELVAYLESLK
jgi:cytochrome c oxidase subunit II